MMNVMKRENRPGDGEIGMVRKQRRESYTSSSSSSDFGAATQLEGSLAQASTKDHAGVPDQIQVYREQIAQIKKLISGAGHNASATADMNKGAQKRGGRDRRSAASSSERTVHEADTNTQSLLGNGSFRDAGHALRSMHQSSQSKNRPSQDSRLGESRTAADPCLTQALQPATNHKMMKSTRLSRSPAAGPLESEYGRRRERELLAEEQLRRSLSRGQQLSREDVRSLHGSSGAPRSASYSVSGDRAYQASLIGVTGAAHPPASQLNTASWNAALTPSHAGSRLSSKAGPPMHMNELQSQDSAVKPNIGAIEGQYMHQVQLIQKSHTSNAPRNQQMYFSQNPEPNLIPVPMLGSLEDQQRAHAPSLQSQQHDRVPQTRNNFDPQTLKSSTDSFTQMQGDILRLQEKIRGLETRLNPAQAQPQAYDRQGPAGQAAYVNRVSPAGLYVQQESQGLPAQATVGRMQEIPDEQRAGYAEELRAGSTQQSVFQDIQKEMQIFDEAKIPVQVDLKQRKIQNSLATQPAPGTTTSSMSTLSPAGTQADYNLPLQRRPQEDEADQKDTQQSSGQARVGPTNLTTFGGDHCQFSNSQIFQRSGQPPTRRDTGDTPEPGRSSTAQLVPCPFPNSQGCPKLTTHTTQSKVSLQNDVHAKHGRNDHALQQQVTAPGAELVNISSLTWTRKDLHGGSCSNATGDPSRRRRAGTKRFEGSRSRGRRQNSRRGSEVPMTSRSHSRSVTTGHRGNLSKVRANVVRKGKRQEEKSGHEQSRNGMQDGLRPQPAAHSSNQQRSRNRGTGSHLTCPQSEEDKASCKTQKAGRSSHRSQKTQKSIKSQRPSRGQHLQSVRGRSQSHKKESSHYGPMKSRCVQSQGSRVHSRISKMSRRSEQRGKQRQSTAAKRGRRALGGTAYSVSDGHSGSGQHPDGASEYRYQERKRVRKENLKLRQKLKVQEEANGELRRDIERLHEKLTYMDELHKKAQQAKMQYGKVLAQLETSEMIRMEQQDKIKELVNKVYKLKRQRRELLDKQNKNVEKGCRGGHIKQSASAAHLSKGKGDKRGKGNGRHHLTTTKQLERATGEAKLKASKSQVHAPKKAYETYQNSGSPNDLANQEQMGSIAREAAQQLLQIQSLHHGLRNQHSKSRSRSRKSGRTAGQHPGEGPIQDGDAAQDRLQSSENHEMEAYIDSSAPADRVGATGSDPSGYSGLPQGGAEPMVACDSRAQLQASASHQRSHPDGDQQLEPCYVLSANWQPGCGERKARRPAMLGTSQQQTAQDSSHQSFHASELMKTHPNRSGLQSTPGRNSGACSRTPGESLQQPTSAVHLHDFSLPSANASGALRSGHGFVETWKSQEKIMVRDQQADAEAGTRADELYMRYRRLRDVEGAQEGRSNDGAQPPPHEAQAQEAARRGAGSGVAGLHYHFSSHKGIEDYHVQALRGSRGPCGQLESRAADGADLLPGAIVNIPIRTGTSSCQRHDTRPDMHSGLCDPDRSAAQDSSVRIEDLFQYRKSRATEALEAHGGGPSSDLDRLAKSRNCSKSAILSKELDMHSSGLSASEWRPSAAKNALSRDTIGSLGGYYARHMEAALHGRHDISVATASHPSAGRHANGRCTEIQDPLTSFSQLQDSAGQAERRSSLGLSNDTEQLSRRYLNLTSQEKNQVE